MPTVALLTEKQRNDLASVVMESANLEHSLDMMLRGITNLTEYNYRVLAGQRTLGPKLDLLTELGARKLRSEKKRKELKTLTANLAVLNRQRVIAVHGVWQPKGGWKLSSFFQFSSSIDGSEAIHQRGSRASDVLKAENLDGVATGIRESHALLWKFWKANWIQPAVRRSLKRRLI